MLLFLNLGFGEVAMIVMVILMFFGSKSIPSLARGLGKGMREFKDAANGIQREIEKSANTVTEEVQKTVKEEEKGIIAKNSW